MVRLPLSALRYGRGNLSFRIVGLCIYKQGNEELRSLLIVLVTVLASFGAPCAGHLPGIRYLCRSTVTIDVTLDSEYHDVLIRRGNRCIGRGCDVR